MRSETSTDECATATRPPQRFLDQCAETGAASPPWWPSPEPWSPAAADDRAELTRRARSSVFAARREARRGRAPRNDPPRRSTPNAARLRPHQAFRRTCRGRRLARRGRRRARRDCDDAASAAASAHSTCRRASPSPPPRTRPRRRAAAARTQDAGGGGGAAAAVRRRWWRAARARAARRRSASAPAARSVSSKRRETGGGPRRHCSTATRRGSPYEAGSDGTLDGDCLQLGCARAPSRARRGAVRPGRVALTLSCMKSHAAVAPRSTLDGASVRPA